MKRNWKNNRPGIFLGCLLLFLGQVSCQFGKKEENGGHQHGAEVHRHSEIYTCPMHPQVKQKGPGTCPICHMELVPLEKAASQDDSLGESLEVLLQPVNTSIVADMETMSPVMRSLPLSFTVNGMISYDMRRTYSIPVRFGGRIEKLFIDYNFQPVQKGQKLLEIYSPEIVTAQREFIYLLESDPDNHQMIRAARQKMSLLGLSEEQINRLAETGEASYSLAVYSPYSGYVFQPGAGPGASGSGIAGASAGTSLAASGSSAPSFDQKELSIREGMYLSRGETAFRVVSTDRVWAELDIDPDKVESVKEGDSVSIVADFDETLRVNTTLDFLQPFFEEGKSFMKARVYLDNTGGRFKPGELITAHFQLKGDSARWVPSTALLDLGTRKVVFVKEGIAFHPRAVRSGARSAKGWVAITSGLSDTDTIAVNGHFLVDSEGFIKVSKED